MTEKSAFDSRRGQARFIFSTSSKPALGPTHPPIRRVPGSLSPGLTQWEMKLTTHLHLAPRLRIRGVMVSRLHTASWYYASLRKARILSFSYFRRLLKLPDEDYEITRLESCKSHRSTHASSVACPSILFCHIHPSLTGAV
jgi:hypothetical protein